MKSLFNLNWLTPLSIRRIFNLTSKTSRSFYRQSVQWKVDVRGGILVCNKHGHEKMYCTQSIPMMQSMALFFISRLSTENYSLIEKQ